MIKLTFAVASFLGLLVSFVQYEAPDFENYQISNCSSYVSVGQQIKTARLEKNMTLEQLAKKSNLNMRQLKYVEAGKAEPVEEIVTHIEKILETTIVYGGYYHLP